MKFLIALIFFSNVLQICVPIIFGPLNAIQDIFKQNGKKPLSDILGLTGEYPYDKGTIPKEFDFIIVGAGAAGCVLANRLSEISDFQVLLLEAGHSENIFSDIPILAAAFQLTDLNWDYRMEKIDGACLGMIDEQCAWPRGRALGGTSVINYMIYTRGNAHDYTKWTAQGNPGWSYEEVLEYYKKSERSTLEFSDDSYHNKNGSLNVANIPYRTPLVDAFIKSAREVGLKPVKDYNGAEHMGFGYVEGTIRNGRRCSASKAFIKPIENRKNLRIFLKSVVSKVLIDPNTKNAYGVEYIRNGKTYKAFAKKEVILSAGTFVSPQLLMLSGVGPEEHLNDFNIPVIQNLPVGEFMQDHLTFVGLTFLIDQPVSNILTRVLTPENFLNYFLYGKGPMTSIGGVEALGYIKTEISDDPDDEYPDIELIFLAGSINSDNGLIMKPGFRIKNEIYEKVYRPIDNKDCWSIIPMLLHPKSYGYVKLRSTSILDHPILAGNYFTDPNNTDIKTMVAAVKEIIKISKTPSFQQFGTKLHDIPLPGCEHLVFNTDEYWECAIRLITPSLHHQVGTCKMGPKYDPTAVVDPELRVHGINNLRVIDSSIIPFALSAHTNAPAFMIGEKGADLIKATWLNNY